MIRCVVTRDGVRVSPVLPDENAAFGWLLQHQPQSVEYAIRYGGYELRRLPDLDARDLDILTRRQEGLDRRQGARVGDFVRMPDGTLRRITHCWNWPEGKESVQLDSPGGGGSYYLGENGHVSYSGGLTPGIPVATLKPTRQNLAGSVWFFHHDWHTAHNGVDTAANFRVWRATETEQD